MKRVIIVFILFITGIRITMAQENDSVRISLPSENSIPSKTDFFSAHYTGFIIPTVFITYGFLAHNRNFIQRLDVSTHQHVSAHFTGKVHADDYIQYVPAVTVFGMELLGVKAKHNLRDRTFLMASSYIISSAGAHAVKRFAHVQRPDESNFLSFPSGHTATAFAGAHLLFREYKDASPWIGIAGYAVAGGTGAIRIYNRRHWVSDVVAGAGFGILSVEISYILLPVFQRIIGDKDDKSSIAVAPVISPNNYGIGIACTF